MVSGVQILESTGGVWSFAKSDSPYDSARVGRWHDLAFLQEGAAASNTVSRAGVIGGPGWTGSSPAGLFVSPTGSGLGVQVFAGQAAVERGSFSGTGWSTFTAAGTGPYQTHLRSTATFTANTASPSSTRIDRVDLQLMDGPGYGDNSGVSYAYVLYTPGTAGSGVPANGPANSIPLSLITIPATTTTLTSGMFTDMRRGASLRGVPRVLMGGDSLADVGFAVGEERIRLHSTYGWLQDYWDAANSVWRGLQVIEIASPTLSTPGVPTGTTATMTSVSISDPGWPYHIEASGGVYAQQTSGVAAGMALLNAGVQVDSATWGTNTITAGAGANYSTSTSIGQYTPVPMRSSKTLTPAGYTGSHTAYFLVNAVGANFSTVANPVTQFGLKLVPA